MTRRRASGEGGLHHWKEKDLWVGRLTLPNGKRKTKYSKKQQIVKDWLLAERGKLKQGSYVPDEKMTVGAFMNRYLEDYGKQNLRQTTYDIYAGWINRHIIPELGKVRLSDLRPTHVSQLLTKVSEKGLSKRSIQMIHGTLKQALNKAVKWELIARNPANMVSPPKVEKGIPSVWTREEVNIFLKSLEGDRWAAVYYLAMTGMRKGEILGLPLSALNMKEGFVSVVQNLQYIRHKGLIFQTPKTAKSQRMIKLPEFILEALRIHLVRRETLSQSPGWKESGLVFTTDIGTPLYPTNVIRHFREKLVSTGLPRIPFHNLRHTTASLLLEKNVHPKLVSELLGHSSIVLTLSTYSHVINPMNTVVSDALDDLVSQ
jgi:integrase